MSFTRRDLLELGLSVAAFGGCCTQESTSRLWNNAINTDGFDPIQTAEPTSLADLITEIKKAEDAGKRVRMSGAGHSFSDVAFTDHLLKPHRLDTALAVPLAQLKAPWNEEKAGLVRIESGRTIRQLNPYLEGKGRAFENLGGFDAQTIVGAATTGTHGSGLAYGPIASQIMSIQIVGTEGKVWQIEPTEGITDRSKFPGVIPTAKGDIPVELKQDDALFNAIAVSMGTMGVVYAVVLRTVDKFWLREVREKKKWTELCAPNGFLRRLIEDKKPPEDPAPDYYEIYFNPYERKGDHSCLVTKRYKISAEPSGVSAGARKRGRLGLPPIEAIGHLTNQGAGLADHMDRFPNAVPNLVEDALNSLQDKEFIDISHRVFHLGPANYLRVMGIEMAFALEQTIAAVERLFTEAKELQGQGWLHSSPPSLRFVKASDAHLAMMNGRDTTMLEMGMLATAHGDRGLLEAYERMYMKEFNARPHWGLDLNILQSYDSVRKLYPNTADLWLEKFQAMNKRGTFDGKLTDRLGISVVKR
jgi:L-gulono-1,4-lactone dehydrogenase